LVVGYNDLATTHPELAKQADGWDPKKVIAGTAKKLSWKCSEGHKWETPGSVRTNGSNCPSCAKYGFNPNQNAFVYFLIQPIWELYQIGITNNFKERFQRHKKNGFELLELRGPMDGQTALELEASLLKYLKNQEAELSPEHVVGKFDGYTESWTIDSYKVNNLKELIDKASEAGF
jgi:predicted GIY-YIG superfamily endonuclease